MAQRRLTRRGSGQPIQPSLFPRIEPLEEEKRTKSANIGFWKQIILYRNKEFMDRYSRYKEDKEVWGWLKKVWEEFSASYTEPYEYNKQIETKRWRFLFELLEYEKGKNNYERLKRNWKRLGDFRKTIIFACSVGKEKHPDFLTWIVWERLDHVKRMENDSIPWIMKDAMDGLLKIMLSEEYSQEHIRLTVEHRIKEKSSDIKETGMYKSPYLRNIVGRAIYGEFLGFLRELCFTCEDIEKIMKRIGKEHGKWLYEKIVPAWIEENKEFVAKLIDTNTASQHTQDV